jgi:circadian clock protein KaiB
MTPRSPTKSQFCLYIAAGTQNSERARVNLAALCKEHLPDRHEVEIVDVLTDPDRAMEDGIFMTPTLLKLWPLPAQRIVGTLNQTKLVLQALDLEVAAA